MIPIIADRSTELASQALRATLKSFETARSALSLADRFDAYLRAAAESQRLLSNAYGPDEIEDLALGPTFHTFA